MNDSYGYSKNNIAETLAEEMKIPLVIGSEERGNIKRIALPPGWTLREHNDNAFLPVPVRKKATVDLMDVDSFIAYVKRHGSLAVSTIWCTANYGTAEIAFKCIINDHGEKEDEAAWRDHIVSFKPRFSSEWGDWLGKNKIAFSQTEFAAFIENNSKDIASIDGSPSGAQMLEMALAFEATQDVRFKSAIRLQNGGVQMSFVQDDDDQTVQKMQMFDRFSLGFPVFWNGDAYRVDARLRYRVREGRLAFWYELIHADKVLESACKTLVDLIKEKTGNPFFFGIPFSD
jgi:uncharacterized protein YfdQ (DUF2303 family)